MFPIGDLEKSEVREKALKQDLRLQRKKIQQAFVLSENEISRNFLVNIYLLNQVI